MGWMCLKLQKQVVVLVQELALEKRMDWNKVRFHHQALLLVMAQEMAQEKVPDSCELYGLESVGSPGEDDGSFVGGGVTGIGAGEGDGTVRGGGVGDGEGGV
ncbi:unnamed protein product [Albugo candida]|uniref:Uncharacterized protein n=1 Tax=Albugo candida TaxID=65357 RepID=A0A024FWH9_9STRA|nr:unnamed protein product [Albugo candida]|eukprot:CCI11292.1 unnamed protein product [Albugo candida]